MARLLTTDWVLEHYRDRLIPLLRQADPSLEPIVLPANGRLEPHELEQIHVAFFHGDFRSDPEFTRRFFGACLRAPNLRWMQLPNSGVDDAVFGRLQANGVTLANAPGAAAEPIAQTAIAGLLILARGFPRWLAAQRARTWDPHPWADAPRDLAGQTAVIVGLGAIGSRIAVLCTALGLRVIGVRRSTAMVEGVDALRRPAELSAAVEGADWLILSCPLTEETRGLVGAEVLTSLGVTGHLINVARGEVVDQQALIAALRQNRLAGAYLDVFDPEPLPSDSPLWTLPNVIITPHDSSASRGNAHRVTELFLRNLSHWQRGEPLDHRIGPVRSS